MSEVAVDDAPQSFSGWFFAVAGGFPMLVAATVVGVAAVGVAALRGQDTEEAFDAVYEPALGVVYKGIRVADKHNDVIVEAGIKAAVGAAAGHGTKELMDRHKPTA
ncbi:hypothetical protein [Streptomyces goshikiensis]|uniref:hypothetical protein n=1 Tax=Streptomyces goshikiensis TaxID=1942 RepID=UPI0036CE5B33